MPVSDEITGLPRRGLTLSLMVVLSACGISPSECESRDHHFWNAPPQDLGDGLVINERGGAYGGGREYVESRNLSVVDCETGIATTFILLDRFETFELDDTEPKITSFGFDGPPIDAGEAGKEFQAYVDAGGFTGLAEVNAKAQELGIVMIERTYEQEDCGCAVFYPGMLGDKEQAQERNA